MSFRSHTSWITPLFWACIAVIIITINWYWSISGILASIILVLPIMFSILSLEMYLKTYKLKEDYLEVSEYFVFKNKIQLDRILTAKLKKTHIVRRYLFGWPKQHIKVYIYPLDYYNIFTFNKDLYRKLQAAVDENPYAFKKKYK